MAASPPRPVPKPCPAMSAPISVHLGSWACGSVRTWYSSTNAEPRGLFSASHQKQPGPARQQAEAPKRYRGARPRHRRRCRPIRGAAGDPGAKGRQETGRSAEQIPSRMAIRQGSIPGSAVRLEPALFCPFRTRISLIVTAWAASAGHLCPAALERRPDIPARKENELGNTCSRRQPGITGGCRTERR